MWLHVWACTLSKLDQDLRTPTARCHILSGDKAAAKYFFDMAETEVRNCFRGLFENDDDSMLAAASAALVYSDELPNSRFAIPEKSPIARGYWEARQARKGSSSSPGRRDLTPGKRKRRKRSGSTAG